MFACIPSEFNDITVSHTKVSVYRNLYLVQQESHCVPNSIKQLVAVSRSRLLHPTLIASQKMTCWLIHPERNLKSKIKFHDLQKELGFLWHLTQSGWNKYSNSRKAKLELNSVLTSCFCQQLYMTRNQSTHENVSLWSKLNSVVIISYPV